MTTEINPLRKNNADDAGDTAAKPHIASDELTNLYAMVTLEMSGRVEAIRQERDAAVARAEQAEAALAQCQWRPPGTLPDKREYVLALVYDPLTRPDVRMAVCRYQFGDWVEFNRAWFTGQVIYWMYQPAAPAYDIDALRSRKV